MDALRPSPAILDELSALLYHLGGDVFVLPVPLSGTAPDVAQLGVLAGLAVWGSAATGAETLKLSRRLARRGQPGLLVAADPAVDRWYASVAIHPVRVVALPKGERDALPFRRLIRAARNPRPTPLEQAIALADALDVDAAGRRTFRLLHELLDRGISLLPAGVPEDERHTWVLAQITRLLFLRFVESEGWLAGNPRFLADAFDRCLVAGRDPTRHLLHPLFFGTLNRPIAQRSRFALAFGAIPFLNGGLFEPHEVERRHRLRLPREFWEAAFAGLVGRVDVTLHGDAGDGRVTPELLGRVFEGVMHPDERKQQGTFFTPPPLVDAMLHEALTCHLAARLREPESVVRRALDDPDATMRRLLLDVTVLDPAVGSGAFLVGALGLLHGPGRRHAARVRHLLTRRLFGIDRHPGAVRICELRLWLELLRAMKDCPAEQVPPLPNLDASVRGGDALLDPSSDGALSPAAARRIQLHHRALQSAHGPAKREVLAALRRAERTGMVQLIDQREAALDRDIAELLTAARAPTLFGDRASMPAITRRALARLRTQRREVRAERRRALRDASAPPFAAAVAFAPVIAGQGGFGMVVGNPPWVRAEALGAATRDALAARYRWWRGSGRGWRHLPDLSVAFVERGFGLLAPGGTLALLLPAKLATADYAATARGALVAKATVHRVADLANDERAGFEATTYPLALIASRRPPAAGHRIHLGLSDSATALPQASWVESGTWSTASPEAQRLAARLGAEHPRLHEQVTAQLGVKTGANAAFLDPPIELRRWCRPAIRGRDIRPFTATASASLLWPADAHGIPWARLPMPVARHLARHRERLERRADQHRGPSWQLFRTGAATAAYRVVWRDLANELQAAVLDDDRAVPLNSCYVAAMSSAVAAESLAAWLNASPVRVLARLTAEPAAGGCARFGARAVGSIPLPRSVLGDPVLASFAHASVDHEVQPALDAFVADVLGLSAVESELLVGLAAHRR